MLEMTYGVAAVTAIVVGYVGAADSVVAVVAVAEVAVVARALVDSLGASGCLTERVTGWDFWRG